MPTHTITKVYQSAAEAVTGTTTVTDDTELNAEVTLAAGATNILLTIAITRANLKCLLLNCAGDCTIKVNSSSAPTDTITLVANTPVIGATAAEAAALLAGTATVTALYLSSTAGGKFTLKSILNQNT